MKVLNHYTGIVKKKAYVFEGKVDVDAKYFISQINKGVEEKGNQSNKTNVKSKMTSFQYFLNDKEFIEFTEKIKPAFVYHNNSCEVKLVDAWGNKILPGCHVMTHDHGSVEVSGVLYLQNGGEETFFTDLRLKIKPEVGKFLLFDSTLYHGAGTNNSNKTRYTMSFNYRQAGYDLIV